jgi:hypothetical protein
MCNHVAKDEQALVEHISSEHGIELYVIELQKIISELAGVQKNLSSSRTYHGIK